MNGITWNFPAAYTAACSLQEEQFSHKLCSVFKQEQGGWSAAHPSPAGDSKPKPHSGQAAAPCAGTKTAASLLGIAFTCNFQQLKLQEMELKCLAKGDQK